MRSAGGRARRCGPVGRAAGAVRSAETAPRATCGFGVAGWCSSAGPVAWPGGTVPAGISAARKEERSHAVRELRAAAASLRQAGRAAAVETSATQVHQLAEQVGLEVAAVQAGVDYLKSQRSLDG